MSDHTMDEQYVAELLTRLAAARKARREAEQQVIADLSKVAALLQVMAPYETEDRVTAALEAWQAASRRSALFQKTGQELGLTDSASPEQILQRAQEVATILRSRSQAQDFDANLLAVLGLPANTSRDAVLDVVKKLVAFRDGRAGVDDFAKRPLLSLSAYELGLLSPQLPDCREGLGKAGSLMLGGLDRK